MRTLSYKFVIENISIKLREEDKILSYLGFNDIYIALNL